MNKQSIIVSLKHYVIGYYYKFKWYSWNPFIKSTSQNKYLIYMCDGRFYSGGMCDRFKGIVSAYAYSKVKGYEFRINYTYPFELGAYLDSNGYNWKLRKGELMKSIFYNSIIYSVGDNGVRFINQNKKNVHFYCNRDYLPLINETYSTNYIWGDLYKDLFTPNKDLHTKIIELQNKIRMPYNAAVFRFQNLLGDFKEYDYEKIRDRVKRDVLLSKCLKWVENYVSKYPSINLLVTSDSVMFLKAVSKFRNVFIIEGNRVHIGQDNGFSADVIMNSFLDFYMIAGSSHVMSVGTKEMYPSEFPQYAAKVNNISFERILI